MTQDEYNTKVKEIQRMWSTDAIRYDTSRDNDGRILSARFQVYWDGHWHTLGTQRKPFQPDVEYEWNDDADMSLRGKFADALARS